MYHNLCAAEDSRSHLGYQHHCLVGLRTGLPRDATRDALHIVRLVYSFLASKQSASVYFLTGALKEQRSVVNRTLASSPPRATSASVFTTPTARLFRHGTNLIFPTRSQQPIPRQILPRVLF